MTTFAELGLEVLDCREKEGVRAVDDERRRFAKHLATWTCAKTDISKIRPKDVALFARTLSQTQADDERGPRVLSPLTVRKVLQLTRNVFDVAIEKGLRDDNPVVVKIRDRARVEEPWTYLSLDEQKAIETCAAISEAARCLIVFAFGTGLRQGEQWSLEMADVHEDHVMVRFGSKGLPTKSGKARYVPLFGFAKRALDRWLAIRPEQGSPLVFPTVTGCMRPKGAPIQFGHWLKQAGITRHVRWHDLRHTCGSSLLSGAWGARWALADIRDMLGHSSVVVTEMYSHLGETSLQQAAARMTA